MYLGNLIYRMLVSEVLQIATGSPHPELRQGVPEKCFRFFDLSSSPGDTTNIRVVALPEDSQ